jgi:hypothetical protein
MMMKRTLFAWLVLASGLLGVAAQAHEGGTHAKGTVKAITAEQIVVTTAGADLAIALTPQTQVLRGHRQVPVTEVHPGERVVVHAAARGGKLKATEVRVAEEAK